MNPFSSPRPLLEMCAAQKRGEARGVTAVCSAHPAVLEAAMCHAQEGTTLLIEATCNQVNQLGGYTGMTPARFAAFVQEIAREAGLPAGRILLGGDHLGPNPWRKEAPAAALGKAAEMVQAYVRAGFNKIHLDASMSCAGDGPLSVEQIAARAADLCLAAENARLETAPVYVIGTEVPPPGGSKGSPAESAGSPAKNSGSETGPQVTSPQDALETLAAFQRAFRARGLEPAWERVIALVVQPGVEFGDAEIHGYQRAQAAGLARAIETLPGLVYEAHSTDYQTRQALHQLVEDHFAILKVGPGLTFAYREALFALEAIEQEQAGAETSPGYPLSRLAQVAEEEMLADPRDWLDYYPGSPQAQAYARKYSLSDRIRYYWPRPRLAEAVNLLLENLARRPPALGLLSQYLPLEYPLVRQGRIPNHPRDLIRAHIQRVLEDYSAACQPARD